MIESTREFFEHLTQRPPISTLQGISGSFRFDIHDAGCWHVDVRKGDITVSEEDLAADATVECEAPIFDRIVRGEANALAMAMQGQISVGGNAALLYVVQRLMAAPIEKLAHTPPPVPEHPVAADQPLPLPKRDEQPPMPVATVSVLEGNTFVVSDRVGDILASPTDTLGLFSWDTRFLSRWQLTVNGITPRSLSTDDLNYHAVQFFAVPATGTIYLDAKLSVVRTREVGHGFHETITILNHANQAVDLEVKIEVGSDFADAFEIKDAVPKRGTFDHRIEGNRLVLGYQRERFRRETWIETDETATITPQAIRFHAHVPSHGEWTTTIDVITAVVGISGPYTEVRSSKEAKQRDIQAWEAAAPKLSCSWGQLERIYQRSIIDLAALRFYLRALPGEAMPAAGLPWFMAVFGRDSIITSLQALPFIPSQAETTLRLLALRQGSVIDDFRDEEPGKIIHEVRFGEMTAFEERPQSPYYGAADSTPLFLILLDEMERWTGNAKLVRELEPAARAALAWIDQYGDRNGDGYVEYNRRNTVTGLENQCWKDSWDAILFADGSMSQLPRSTCEIQGYVYDAKRRCARLARQFWHDDALADRLDREAAEFKQRFNHDFWLPDRGYFALAINGDGRLVDSLTSNIGHLLWSGIVDDDKAAACVHHLMGERLYSGWGVRTMAEGDCGYNPIGYHVGTVWPHDCSIIAQGLARYGYRREAAKLAMNILEAAPYFHYRLPEAFAGYPRSFTEYPVEYPTACSPQAWSAGTPLLLLQSILGLQPVGDHLVVDPVLPEAISWLGLIDMPGRWGRQDAFARGKSNGHDPSLLVPHATMSLQHS